MSKHVLLVGGTGLVGRNVKAAIAEYCPGIQLTLLVRRSPDGAVSGDNLEYLTKPSDQWADAIADAKPEAVICCLGTTMRKAGSKTAFRAVDLDLAKQVAEASKAAGAEHFLSVSSLSANSDSALFYMKTKGEAEDAIKACGFDRTDIMQPGLLRGERDGDVRFGESFAMMLSPLTDAMLLGSLRKYRSIAGRDVARAMVALLDESKTGVFVHRYDEIRQFAAKIGDKS